VAFDLIVVEEPSRVRIKIYGQKTSETMDLIWKQIVGESQRSPSKPVLVEDYMEGSISPAHFFQIERMVRNMGLPRSFRVSVADLRTTRTYDDDRFGETVAHNLGWYQIRVFPTLDEAEAWLDQDAVPLDGGRPHAPPPKERLRAG
jgi:hypothetical protein